MFINRQRLPRLFAVIGLAVATTGGLVTVSRAQAPEGKALELKIVTPEGKADQSAARALFDEVAKAYKALTSYSDKGEFALALKIAGKKQGQTIPLNLTFVRPNKVNFSAGEVRLTSDGTTMTTVIVPLKRFTTGPAPKVFSFDTFREGPLGSVLFGGPSGPPMFILLNLLTSNDPAAAVAQLGGSMQLLPATSAKGAADSAKKPAPGILIDLGQGKPSIALEIDPTTKLLSKIDLKIDAAQIAAGAPPGVEIAIDQFGWSAGAVSTSAPKPDAFAFEPPKGFTKVDSLLEPQEDRGALDSKVGKPAPDFTLTLLDGPDKTKTVTKAELAGKVVVIDFWATWCRPCLMELPEIQKLIESYADSKKDVLVVALSQDEEPAELAAVRKLVEKTLGENKLNLTSNPVGRIGLDPSKSVGSAFGLEGYPTLVILDAKGVVQAVHVGYNPDAPEPLHKSLAKEINSIMEGKSTAVPAAKTKEPAAKP
jgi:thiol-disulfide isomerase/thioredoxin